MIKTFLHTLKHYTQNLSRNDVLHFHVLQFHVLQSDPSFYVLPFQYPLPITSIQATEQHRNIKSINQANANYAV